MAYYTNLLGIGPEVPVMAIQRPTVSPYAAAYTPTGILPLPPAPVAAPVVAPAAPVAPVAPPPKMALPPIRPLPVPFDENVDTTPPSEPRTAANNWGYASDLERGLLGMALPFGTGWGLGAANNWQAMQMDRTGWGKQFSPSFFDVLTGGIFAGPGYKQSVLNMENRNIAGRPGLLGKSPFMDYTHRYGPNFMDDVKEYDPWDGVNYADPSSVAAAEAVDNIAAAQEAAALQSNLAPTIPANLFYSGDEDFGGYGGAHDETTAGEMDSGVGPGGGYDDGFDHGMGYDDNDASMGFDDMNEGD